MHHFKINVNQRVFSENCVSKDTGNLWKCFWLFESKN